MVARDRRRHPGEKRVPRAGYYSWKKDEIEKILDSLRKKAQRGVPIVVEGRRDKEALYRLAVDGVVLSVKGTGQSKSHFLDSLHGLRDIILLTDFDAKGIELRQWLYRELTTRGIRAEDLTWRRIKSLARTEVRSVEELPSFLRSMEAKSRGQRPEKPRHIRPLP